MLQGYAQLTGEGTLSLEPGCDYGSRGGVSVAFSGVLLNQADLQKRCGIPKGTVPELLLNLYEKHTECVFEYLNGPFVIALLDTTKAEPVLLLVRDQHGQRGLFYCATGEGTVRFSENLNAVVPSDVDYDLQSLAHYFASGYFPAPRTIFANVQRVSSGHYVRFSTGGSWREFPYWHPFFAPRLKLNLREAVEEGQEVIQRAVKRCLDALPDSGVLLSGGIDSNVVLGMTASLTNSPVEAFTIGFSNPAYDERALASLAAEQNDALHFTQQGEPADISLVKEIVCSSGEPFADSSLLPTTLAMQLSKQHGKTVLTGDGGDELFGGYRRYRLMALRERLSSKHLDILLKVIHFAMRFLPDLGSRRGFVSDLKRFANAMVLPPVPCYACFQNIFDGGAFKRLCPGLALHTRSFLIHWTELFDDSLNQATAEKCNELDLRYYLPDDMCQKSILASHYAENGSLAPLLDMDVTTFAMSLPQKLRITPWKNKPVLAEIGKKWMPPQLWGLKKMGFGMPLDAWLRKEWLPEVRKMQETLPQWDTYGLFSPQYIQQLIEEHLQRKQDNSSKIWALLCLSWWIVSR